MQYDKKLKSQKKHMLPFNVIIKQKQHGHKYSEKKNKHHHKFYDTKRFVSPKK